MEGLEKKLKFTNGKHSHTTQFSKQFVKVAGKTLPWVNNRGHGSNIFTLGDSVHCYGVSAKFDVYESGFGTTLDVSNKEFKGSEFDHLEIQKVAQGVVEALAQSYGISKINYK